MKQLAVLALLGLLVLSVVACGSETAEPTNTPAPAATAVPPTSPPPAPTSTPVPEPTTAPTEAPEPTPTTAPEPSPTPEPEPTAAPDPTDTPTPTETPAPAPTETPAPQPTDTPEPAPTATPEPTATPPPTREPEPTDPPIPPIAMDFAALGDNLLWVAYIDAATQRMSAYNPSGTFTPEQAAPPGAPVPDASEVAPLTQVQAGRVHVVAVAENQTVELRGRTMDLYAGINYVFLQ